MAAGTKGKTGTHIVMSFAPRRFALRSRAMLVIAASALAVTACAQKPTSVASSKQTRSKEYFAESKYGVRASPRVSNLRTNLPRGGGRDQVGKPYKVAGKWYHPKEDPNYRASGQASWYGDAFHGRLTANGEVYDMTHLTAAHPTMPLPSYARVTNKANGNSLIVRVNDRGPFHANRVIDLSRRAAEMLDYTRQGVATVHVEYLGRAPLHGQDDAFLMASYRPGGRGPDPSDGLPTGVMIAMNGPTPAVRASASASAPVPSAVVGYSGTTPDMRATGSTAAPAFSGAPALPALGPMIPARPGSELASDQNGDTTLLGYADRRIAEASAALAGLAGGTLTEDRIRAWKLGGSAMPAFDGEYVAVGAYETRGEAEAAASRLSAYGRPQIEVDGGMVMLSLIPDGRHGIDDMLRQAWAAGAQEAMTVRQ